MATEAKILQFKIDELIPVEKKVHQYEILTLFYNELLEIEKLIPEEVKQQNGRNSR